MKYKYDISKEQLTELYLNQKRSIKSISETRSCSARTIHRRLNYYKIKTRTPWEHKKIFVNSEKIRKSHQKERKSINKIAKELGLSYSKLRSEMIKNNIPRRNSIELSLNKPNLKPTKNLCYILGILCGDGYLYKNGSNYCIALETVELNFIKSFKKALEKIGLIVGGPYSRKRSQKNKIIHKIETRSKLFFEWYQNTDIIKIKKFVNKTKGELDFIKGVYESEGSYFLTKEKKKILTLASTNKELMLYIRELSYKFGFSPTFPKSQYLKSKKPYYKLYFNKQDEIKKFIELINPGIKKRPCNIN